MVILVGLDKTEEMHQFQVVNSTQKSVRTDLVSITLAQTHKDRGDDALMAKKNRAVVSQVLARLNDDPSSPWYQRILMPNRSMETDLQTVRSTSIMTAIRPIENRLFDRRYDKKTVQQRVDITYGVVDPFWRAVRRSGLAPLFRNAWKVSVAEDYGRVCPSLDASTVAG